jgi:MOSC domain-containing protein YiiM
MQLLHLYLSPGHNYFGHHEQPAGTHPVIEVNELLCVAGAGVRGDRFFNYKPDYKGQITFFADEVYRALCQQFAVADKSPAIFRRNVITRDVNLDSLIGQEFAVQGVRFCGVEECKPCYWMDQAFGPGAEAALQGRGGLRARIPTDGVLRPTSLLDRLAA